MGSHQKKAALNNNNVNTKNDKSKTNKLKGPGPIGKLYLILYNFLQTIGWSYLFYQFVEYHIDSNPSKGSLYDKVRWTVIIFQNAAVLEVVHAVLRLVPSSPIITMQQVASRVIVVCGVLMATVAARNTVGFPLLLTAWSITEIIRYSNYTLNLVGMVPHFIIWLRYTTFIVLYPLGVTGELLCLYAAAQEVGETKLWTYYLPNSMNFIFSYKHLLLAIMALYVPLFPQMYMHMVNQRKKVLGSSSSSQTKKLK